MYSVVLIVIAVSGYEDSSFASVRALLLRALRIFTNLWFLCDMQIIFRYFAADKFVRKEDGGAVRRRAATRRDTPFEADVRPSGGGREEAAVIKPQDLIRLIPSEGVFPVRSARHGRRFPFS